MNEDGVEKIPSPEKLAAYSRQTARRSTGPLIAGTLAVSHQEKIDDDAEGG